MNRRKRTSVEAALCAVCCVFGAAATLAEPGATVAAHPWLAFADAEPLELAAVVDRVGDDAVLARLGATVPAPPAPTYARVAAARAAPFLRSPELALAALAKLAASRDPELAPIAARSARAIAQRLAREGLANRELLPASLADAKAALGHAAATASLRADVRLWLEEAAHLLAALGVP